MKSELDIAGKNLEGRWVVIKQSYFGESYKGSRVAKAVSGFGCSPTARGRAVHVVGCSTSGRINRSDVERFATDEEIAIAQPNAAPGGEQ